MTTKFLVKGRWFCSVQLKLLERPSSSLFSMQRICHWRLFYLVLGVLTYSACYRTYSILLIFSSLLPPPVIVVQILKGLISSSCEKNAPTSIIYLPVITKAVISSSELLDRLCNCSLPGSCWWPLFIWPRQGKTSFDREDNITDEDKTTLV